MSAPTDSPDPPKRALAGLADPWFGSAADPFELAWLDCSDLGNAGRLEARGRGRLVWDGAAWLAFTGTHWSAEDGPRLSLQLAHEVARGVLTEREALAAHQKRLREKGETDKADGLRGRLKQLGDWARESGMAARSTAMLRQAAAYLACRREDFDQDLLALNVLNGTLRIARSVGDVVSVELAEHDPGDRITRVAAVAYDAGATCPGWEAHLARCLPDPEVRDFLQTVVGYALTGHVREQCVFVLQGKGGDGKSTTMNVLRRVLGGFAAAADVKTFLEGGSRDSAAASPDLARLAGDVRLVSTSEPGLGQAFNESLLKAFTGGSPLVARALHGEPFEFSPRGKLVIECNARPRIKGGDDGIWRRMVVIPFPVQIPKGEMEKGLEDRLVREGPGILNWALQGLARWLEEGLIVPAAVAEAVDDYRRASNPFGEWFQERLELGEFKTAASVLLADYKDWCAENGHEPMTATAFGRALGDRQIVRCGKTGEGNVLRRGARIRPGGGGFGVGFGERETY